MITSFSQDRLMDCLSDPKTFNSKYKEFKIQFSEQKQEYILLTIIRLRDELLKATQPIAKMHVMRAIKQAVDTGSFGVLQVVETEVLPILEKVAVFKFQSPDQDRGKSMFLSESKKEEPKEKMELQKVGNSYLRLVLECIQIWASIKPYFAMGTEEVKAVCSGYSALYKRLKEQLKVTFPDKRSYYKPDDPQKFRFKYLQSLQKLEESQNSYSDYYVDTIHKALESEEKFQNERTMAVINMATIPDIMLEKPIMDLIGNILGTVQFQTIKLMCIKLMLMMFLGGSIYVIDRVQYDLLPIMYRIVKQMDQRKDLSRGAKLSPNNPGLGQKYYGQILKCIVLFGQCCRKDPLTGSETQLCKTLGEIRKSQYELPMVVQLSDFRKTYKFQANLQSKLNINHLYQRRRPVSPAKESSSWKGRVPKFSSKSSIVQIVNVVKSIHQGLLQLRVEDEKSDGVWLRQASQYLEDYNREIELILEDNLELSDFDKLAVEVYQFMEENIGINRHLKDDESYASKLKSLKKVLQKGYTPGGADDMIVPVNSRHNPARSDGGTLQEKSQIQHNNHLDKFNPVVKRLSIQDIDRIMSKSKMGHGQLDAQYGESRHSQNDRHLAIPQHADEKIRIAESLPRSRTFSHKVQEHQVQGGQRNNVGSTTSDGRKEQAERKEESQVIKMYQSYRKEDIRVKGAEQKPNPLSRNRGDQDKFDSFQGSIIDNMMDFDKQSQLSNPNVPFRDNNQSLIRKPGSASKNRIGLKKADVSVSYSQDINISKQFPRRSLDDMSREPVNILQGLNNFHPQQSDFKKKRFSSNLPNAQETFADKDQSRKQQQESQSRLDSRRDMCLIDQFKRPVPTQKFNNSPSLLKSKKVSNNEQNSEIMEPNLQPMQDSFYEPRQQMRQQLDKLSSVQAPEFNMCFEAEKYLLPSNAFGGEAKKFWLQQDAQILNTFNRSGNEPSLKSQMFSSSSPLSIPEILSEQNKHFQVQLGSMREQHRKEVSFLEAKIRKLERYNKEHQKVMSQQRQELESIRGGFTSEINLAATLKSQKQQYLEHQNQVLKNRLEKETRSFVHSRNMSPASLSDGFARSAQLSRMKTKLNKGAIFPSQPYQEYLDYLTDTKTKKPMLKSKDLLVKNQSLQVGFIVSKEKGAVRSAFFFQSEMRQLSEVKLQLNSKGLSLDCYPSQISRQMKPGKQERYVVVLSVDSKLRLPYEIPEVEISYKSKDRNVTDKLRFFVPLTFNRLLEYFQIDGSRFKQYYKQLAPNVLKGQEVSYNKKILRDVQTIKQVLPKLQTINPHKESLFLEGRATLKFGVRALYQPLGVNLLIKLNFKPGNVLYIQTVPLAEPSPNRIVEEFLICTLNQLLKRQKLWS